METNYNNIPHPFLPTSVHTCAPLVRVVVVNENALGYIYPDKPTHLSVLRASIIKSSRFRSEDGPQRFWDSDVIRPATKEDFDTFRVSFAGYERQPCIWGYVYDIKL